MLGRSGTVVCCDGRIACVSSDDEVYRLHREGLSIRLLNSRLPTTLTTEPNTARELSHQRFSGLSGYRELIEQR